MRSVANDYEKFRGIISLILFDKIQKTRNSLGLLKLN